MKTKSLSLAICFLLFSGNILRAQVSGAFAETQILDPNIGSNAMFGRSIDLSGNTMVVGTPGDNSVSIYDFTTTWNLTQKIKPGFNFSFGADVAIFDQDVAVSVTQVSANPLQSGGVHIYSKSGGTYSLSQTFTSGRKVSYDSFGYQIAMDRNIMVVGAVGYDTVGRTDCGAVYIYEKLGNKWVFSSTLMPTDLGSGDRFGYSISVRNGIIAVGAPGHDLPGTNAGAVYVFKKLNGSWSQVQKITRTQTFQRAVGLSVAVSEDKLIYTSTTNNTSIKCRVEWFEKVSGAYTYMASYAMQQINFLSTGFVNASCIISQDRVFAGISGNFFNDGEIRELVRFGSIINTAYSYTSGGVGRLGSAGTFCIKGQHAVFGGYSSQSGSNVGAGKVYYYTFKPFTASKKTSDAWTDLNWRIQPGCANAASKPVYLQLYDVTNDEEISHEIIDSIYQLDEVFGSFRHIIKQGKTNRYELRLFEYGSGTPYCINQFDTGSTEAFRLPVLSNNYQLVHNNIIQWTSNSDYTQKYKLYRNGEFIALLDKNVTVYEDPIKPGVKGAAQSGVKYNYCLQAINSTFNDTATRQCIYVQSVGVNFSITNERNLPPAQALRKSVDLKWANMDQHISTVTVLRDGKILTIKSASDTTFSDLNPIPGKAHVYTLVLESEGTEMLRISDTGSIIANGFISGRVLHKDSLCGMPNVKITATAKVDDKDVTYTTRTDATGAFLFSHVYYGSGATFTLAFQRTATTFEPASGKAPLSLDATKIALNVKANSTLSVLNNPAFTVSNFNTSREVNKDRIKLTWTYSSSDTTYFRLMRNGEVQNIFYAKNNGNFTAYDTTGLPGYNYEYELVAYRLKGNKYAASSLRKTDSFPLLYPIQNGNFTGVPNAANGTVDLSWTHSSSNFETFEIYRRNTLIASIPVGKEMSFVDKSGANNLTHNYSIITVRHDAEGNRFTSAPTRISVAYPALEAATNVHTDTVWLDMSSFQVPNIPHKYILKWDYPRTTAYNFDGFIIKKHSFNLSNVETVEELVRIGKGYKYAYIDENCIAKFKYYYEVIAYKADSFSQAQSASSPQKTQFDIPVPPQFFALNSFSNEGFIDVLWTRMSGALDGYLLMVGTDTLGWLDGNRYTFVYALPVAYTSKVYSFKLTPYKIIKGTKYFGTTLQSDVTPPTPAAGTLPNITKLKGSSDNKYQVALTWSYPDYVVPTFVILRNGTFLDSVRGTIRAYYDKGAVSGQTFAYTVYAKIGTKVSRKAYTTAKASGNYMVYGTVTARNSKVGIEGVTVTLLRNYSYFNTLNYKTNVTKTDKSGYFSIPFDFEPGDDNNYEHKIVVSEPNCDFNGEDTQWFFPAYNSFDYEVNFLENTRTVSEGDTLAVPVLFTVTPNKILQRNELRWAVLNSKYSGFKVYRGLRELADVKVGAPMQVLDLEGEPNYDYAYRIKAYLTNNGATTESEYANAYGRFPELEPVKNLTASLMDDYVKLQWTHVSDLHSYYEIKRNNKIIGVVNTKPSFNYIDSQTAPGQLCNYEVTAVWINEIGAFRSEGTKVSATFPQIASPMNVATIAANNRVTINWYSNSIFPVRYNIYRDGIYIGSTKANGLGNHFYEDFGGAPLKIHEYAVAAVVIRNKNEFTSRRSSAYATFPVLDAVATFTANPVVGFDKVNLAFSYTSKGAQKYRIYRSYNSSQLLIKEITSRHDGVNPEYIAFEDFTGSPGTNYTYQVIAVCNRFNKEYVSASVTQLNAASVQFPVLSSPFNLTATTDKTNYIQLKWEHRSPSITNFKVYKSGQLLATLNGNQRSYTDLNPAPSPCTDYTVQAQITITSGNPTGTYTSGAASASGTTDVLQKQRFLMPCNATSYMNNGYSGVDFNGSFAAYGTYSSNQVTVHKLNADNSWTQTQIISGPSGTSFGRKLALDGDILIVGAPNYNSNAGNVYLYKFNSSTELFEFYREFNFGLTNTLMGTAVDVCKVSSTLYNIVFTGPGYDSYSGLFYAYQLNISTGSITNITAITGGTTRNVGFGDAAAITANFIAVSRPFANAYAGDVYKVALSGTTASAPAYINGTNASGELFGRSLSGYNNELLVGAPQGDVGLGTTFWFNNVSSASPTKVEIFQPSGDYGSGDEFGNSVYLYGTRVIIGSRYHSYIKSASEIYSYIGAAYVFSRSGNTWTLQNRLHSNKRISSGYFGEAVAIRDGNALVAQPYWSEVNTYDGIIHHFQLSGGTFVENADRKEITSLAASDGAYPNQCLLQWTFTGTTSTVKEFQIFRDDIFIGTADPGKDKYFDKEGTPGKKHVYSIKAVYTDGVNGAPIADLGYRLGNGEIQGQVVTYQTGDGVPGVIITARATIDGDIYEFRDTTDETGNYIIENVYYGDVANYVVSPYFEGHSFEKDTLSAKLKPTVTQAFLSPFRDLNAYLISGNVKRANVGCGLDSIKLRLKIYTLSGSSEKTGYTNKNGDYAFVIDPFNLQINRYVLIIDKSQRKDNNPSTQELYYQWSLDSLVIPRNTIKSNIVKDITDNLTYPVKMSVESSCGLLGTMKFTYLVKSTDGCYEQSFLSADNGIFTANLPPLDYKIVVSDILPLNSANIPIVDYLKVRPRELMLASMHRDSLQNKKKLGQNPTLTVPFIYHKSPQIKFAGIGRHLCNDPAMPALYNQGSDTTTDISVVEVFNGIECPVNEGLIVVRNTGATSADSVQLQYSKTLGGFPQYHWTVGDPAIIKPYQKYLIAEYHTVSDGFLGENIQNIIIFGTRPQPGNDVLVKNDGNGLQLPLAILRDPPGDESQSWIEKGTTFTRHFSMSDQNSGYVGAAGKTGFAFFGIGAVIEASFKGGGGSGRRAEMEVTVTTRQRISTSGNSGIDNAFNSDYLVGDQADVIVGAGLAMTMGIADEIYLKQDCSLGRRTLVTIQPNGVKTTWVYTVTQIERLIADYTTMLSDEIDLSINYPGKSLAEARREVQTIIDNWKNVLRYHREASAPFLQLCDKNNYNYLPEPFRTNAKDWVDKGFCSEIGTYKRIDGIEFFTMKPRDPAHPENDIQWTEDLMTKYRKVNQFVRDLGDDDFQSEFPAGRAFSQDRLDDIDIDAEYIVQYGADAENITFAGQTSIEKEISVQKSKSRSYIQNTFFESELYMGLIQEVEVKLSTGAGLGAFFIVENNKAIDLEGSLGISAGYNFEYEQETTNTLDTQQTVGYLLQDNDAGDQFSVNIFRGVDPAHTPYFWTFGGRSSCPNEPFTIPRDQAQITLESADGKGFNTVQQDIPPDQVIAYPVKMSNLAPAYFNESRYFSLSLVQNSNKFGAIVESQGIRLGEAQYRMPPTEPIYTYAYVSKGSQFYDYDDIVLTMTPTCPDNSISNHQSNDLLIEAHFRHECSNVSIVEPGDNWVIKKAGTNTANEAVIVYVSDYDLTNPKLQSVTLQYRLVGSSEGWRDYKTLTKAQLQAYYEENKATYKEPKYPFVFDIKNNDVFIDGTYELRAMNTCGTAGFVFSNVITGKVDRANLSLFGSPLPNDGLLSLGDEISVAFNKNVQCARIKNGVNYVFMRKRDSAIINMQHSCFGNKIIFTILDSIPLLDGETIMAKVMAVQDLAGNTLTKPIEWEFEVSYNPVYWNPNKLVLNMYRNSRDTITANLLNTGVGTHAFTLTSKNQPWLSHFAISNFVPPSGQKVDLRFNATGLPLGVYYDTLRAKVNGFTTELLPVEMHVLAAPPVWTLTQNKYESSETFICNFDKDSSGALSDDTMDRIAAYIGSELRGVANITRSGNYYRALITIQGNDADNGREIDFRVWDASAGTEYDGHVRSGATYTSNKVDGSTVNPRILDVSTLADSARYIRLTKGWNHLAFNTTMADMRVDKVLRNLHSAEGDLIKSQDKTASYSPANRQWISTDAGLKTLDAKTGYMIFVSRNDSLRISGKNAEPELTVLNKGWTLIGNIAQKDAPVNEAYGFTNLSNGAIMKNFSQSFSYDSASKTWSGPAAVQTNSSYWIRNGKFGTVTPRANNADTTCATLNIASYDKTINLFGIVMVNGVEMSSADFKVRALINGECRGTGQLEYNAVLKRYVLSMLVYHVNDGDKVSFKLVRPDGSTLDMPRTITFTANYAWGTPDNPFIFTNGTEGLSTKPVTQRITQAKAYPVPFTSELKLDVNLTRNQKITVELIDQLGRILSTQTLQAREGDNTFTLDASAAYVPGIYFLRLSTGKAQTVIRVIKQ